MKVLGMEDVELADELVELGDGLVDSDDNSFTFEIQFDCGCLADTDNGLVTPCSPEHDPDVTDGHYAPWRQWCQRQNRYTWYRRLAWALTIGLMFSVPLIAYMVLTI